MQKLLPCPPEAIWKVIADLTQFARKDPFHHDFTWIGDQREDVGTRFQLRHTYAPLFPFASDHVTCTVSEWRPGKQLKIIEHNERAYRSHTQEFVLEDAGAFQTKLTYRIAYRGIPWILFPWRFWVRMQVLRRMRQKGEEIKSQLLPLSHPLR